MGYVGNAPAEKYTTIDKQTLTGNSTVGPYTLTHSVGNEQEIEVFVNNVRQEPGVSYTVSSNQLTMSASVASADDFYVIFQGKAKMTATHPPTFDLTAANGTFTGTVTTGGLTVGSDTAKTKFYSNSTYNGIYNGSALTNNESIYMGSGTLFFYSGGGERMRIDSSGRVGIGTTTHYDSSTKLTVEGRINTSNGTAIGSMNYGGGAVVNVGSMSNHPLQFITNNTTRATIDNNGNVGIGHVPSGNLTAGYVLRLDGGSQTYIALNNDTHTTQVTGGFVIGSDSTAARITQRENQPLIFDTNDTERLRITSGGNVGIGTSSPASPTGFGTGGILHLKGSTGNDASIVLEGLSGFGGRQEIGVSGGALQFYRGAATGSMTESMRILSTGDIAFGNTAANLVSNTSTQGGGGYVASDKHFEFATDSNRSAVEIGKNNANDGQLVAFRKQGTTVGTIGVGNASSYIYIGTGDTGLMFNSGNDFIQPWNPSANTTKDNGIDLGRGTSRFKDLYLSSGVYLGGTGSANHLDDYEQGTWTVNERNGQASLTTNRAHYTKIGNMVYAAASVNIGSNSNGNPLNFTLPFTSSINGYYLGGGNVSYHSITGSASNNIRPNIENAADNVFFLYDTATNLSCSQASGHRIDFFVIYHTSA